MVCDGQPAEATDHDIAVERAGPRLGVVASGLGYFMWNYGATRVDAGTLGIMNNVHVPAGLLGESGYLAGTAALAEFYYGWCGDNGLAVGASALGRSALRTNGR